MSDDLVKRLRDCEFMGMPDARLDYCTAHEAADRIEDLEAKLAKAVEALEKVSQLITDQYADRLYTQTGAGWEHCGDDIKEEARTTLTELKGKNDE